MNTLSKLLLFASAWLVLTSCDSGVPSSDSGSNNLTLGTPLFLSVKAVDEEQLTPELQVNGSPIALTALGGGQYAGTVQVPEGSDVTIEISWTEMYEGTTPLMLARFTQTINGINQNLGIRIRDEDYDKSLDEDSDGISNLQERIDDTDPFDQFDPADGGIRVNVPYIDPEIAPVIDGSWETVWNRATFLDRNDETLFIDNLMINQGAIREDGDTEYRWGAMHDGVNLYLWVEGSFASARSHFGDSLLMYNDDAIEIFWDGDNSKGAFYDLVDDFQIIIPLLTQGDGGANSSDLSNARITQGENSLPVPSDTEFATCIFCALDIWEVKINLNQAKIPVGTPIGFEMQMDDDNDGGERDVKWGWVHPSRTDRDIDQTWQQPNLMSTIRLFPPPVLSSN